MRASKALSVGGMTPCLSKASKLALYVKRVPQFRACTRIFSLSSGSSSSSFAACSCGNKVSSARTSSSPPPQGVAPDVTSSADTAFRHHTGERLERLERLEENVEKIVYRCRFLAILAVWGSLIGSFLCFVKGCTHIVASFQVYLINRAKVIKFLVEAVDIYLLGTVMLVFGMGLYELFISNLDKSKQTADGRYLDRSNFFGLFALKERPRWLEISTVNELKTKLGHVIVMLLLIGLFEKSKKAMIVSPLDLLCFSASILLCSGCLFLLSKLND